LRHHHHHPGLSPAEGLILGYYAGRMSNCGCGSGYSRDYNCDKKDRPGFWSVLFSLGFFAKVYNDLGLEGALLVFSGLLGAVLIFVVPMAVIPALISRFQHYQRIRRVKERWKDDLLAQISTT
jgi:hypothetical protein